MVHPVDGSEELLVDAHAVRARTAHRLVDQQLLAPVGRMGFPWFTRSTPESMFQLSRVPYDEFAATGRRPGPMD